MVLTSSDVSVYHELIFSLSLWCETWPSPHYVLFTIWAMTRRCGCGGYYHQQKYKTLKYSHFYSIFYIGRYLYSFDPWIRDSIYILSGHMAHVDMLVTLTHVSPLRPAPGNWAWAPDAGRAPHSWHASRPWPLSPAPASPGLRNQRRVLTMQHWQDRSATMYIVLRSYQGSAGEAPHVTRPPLMISGNEAPS